MAFYTTKEIGSLYTEAIAEAKEHRKDYAEFERLADNGLIEGLDEALPEVNDGSLAAALFKLPKRVIDPNLTGRVKALDSDDEWLTELANIYWEKKIVPNANTQAPFIRKWKDVARKAAIYGSQPVIELFVKNGSYTGSDFIVPYVQDVKLEPGKVSDQDSDIIFWDVYYTVKQVETLLEQAEAETKEKTTDGYNEWDIDALKKIIASKQEEEKTVDQQHRDNKNKSVKTSGVHFCIAFQRGVEAPFYMYHKATDSTVRKWSNPDPTGDIPVHYVYCYQDFNNPYGIGIVKLAGGTQNSLDILRKYDILATQLGVRPPKLIEGNEDDIDEDSMVYEEDANWYVGGAKVTRMEMANGVYSQLPERMSMYKASLSQLIPTGDTSTSQGQGGDPIGSRTPAGVKLQAASLSIDDDDFKDNLYEVYALVAKSMINIQFANMQGSDILKLSKDEVERLQKAGLDFPLGENGQPSQELEVIWDNVRATFDFEIVPEEDRSTDEAKRLEGLLKILELRATDPTLEQSLMESGKKLNLGELFSSIIQLTTENKAILTEITPEEKQGMEEEAEQSQIDPQTGQPIDPLQQGQDPQTEQALQQSDEKHQLDMQGKQMQLEAQAQKNGLQAGQQSEGADPDQQQMVDMQAIMEEHGVDEETALTMLEAEQAGLPPEQILRALQMAGQEQ